MGRLLETIYDLMVKPKVAIEEIIQTKSVLQAFQVVLISTILSTLAIYAGTFEGTAKWFIVILQILSSVFVWGLSAAIWHLFAELLGASGSIKKLITAIGFVYFIQILIIPIYLLASFIPDIGVALVAIATILFTIWSITLEIFAIGKVYSVSGAKATLILFLPVIIIFCLIIGVVIIASSFFMSAATEFLSNPPQF